MSSAKNPSASTSSITVALGGSVARPKRSTTVYLSYTRFTAGIGLLVGSVWLLGLLALAMGLMDRIVIADAERRLSREFGHAYRDYRAGVRRWLSIRPNRLRNFVRRGAEEEVA